MRRLWVLFWLVLPLAADTAVRVVAVERLGWPPYEDDRRIYRLQGEEASRLRPGEVLQLFRPGDPRNPGRLKVAFLEPGRASAYLEAHGATYPLVGDLALSRRLDPVPALPVPAALPDLSLHPPKSAPPAEAPGGTAAALAAPVPPAPARWHESIYFLEGDGSLSPKGREKLQQAVRAWGVGGRWTLAVPASLLLPEKVKQARIQALRKALGALGVGTIEVAEVPRRDGDTGDVVYVEKG